MDAHKNNAATNAKETRMKWWEILIIVIAIPIGLILRDLTYRWRDRL